MSGTGSASINEHAIAVSTVAFDGHPIELALETIARLGAAFVEPAYISGGTSFDEGDLSEAAASSLRARMEAACLGCLAVSAHMDCASRDALDMLTRRLRFAALLGARFVITNTTNRDRKGAFLAMLSVVLPLAEKAGVTIAFENPGHGVNDLMRSADDADHLLASIGSARAVLNYDVGNLLTNSEGETRPEADLPSALRRARHLHLKDVIRRDDRWVYTGLGEGELDYGAILAAIGRRPDLPLCVELPLRQVRRVGQAPVRADDPVPISLIRETLSRSLARLRS